MLQPMYRLKNTIVVQTAMGISASTQEIEVTDITAFADAPNYATIGSDNTAEVIKYNGIDVANKKLTGCLRGQSYTNSKSWDLGSDIANTFTTETLSAIMNNIEATDGGLTATNNAFETLQEDVSTTITSLDSRVTTSETTANNAATTAGQAKTTADTAQSTADTAKATAEGAATTAGQAKTTADSAATTAGEAETTAQAAIDDAAVAGDMAAAANAAARAVTVNGIPQVVEEGESTGDIPITATNLPTSPIEGLTAQDVQGALEELNGKASSVRRDITILQSDWVEIDDGFIATIMDESVTENTYIDVIFGRAAAALCPAGIYDRAMDEGQSQVAGQYTLVTDEMPEGDISGVAILKEVSEDAD